MEKTITNNTETPQGYYDDMDSNPHIVQPGETITLIYKDPVNQLATVLEDLSLPPAGFLKIKNIYVDPATNKTVVEFKDEPEEE